MGLPHSEILGSQLVCSSPRLIAAYHVLHRLPVPRHPPCALTRLISEFSTRCDSLTPLHHALVSFQRAVFRDKKNSPQQQRITDRVCEVRATLEAFRRAASRAVTQRSRKEVIQPQVPLRLPCYDFAPVTDLTLAGCPLAVGHRFRVPPASMA